MIRFGVGVVAGFMLGGASVIHRYLVSDTAFESLVKSRESAQELMLDERE